MVYCTYRVRLVLHQPWAITVSVLILGMRGSRSTQSSDLHDRQVDTIARLMTQVRGHLRSDKSRLVVLLIHEFWYSTFLDFSKDAFTSLFGVETRYSRTSFSFLSSCCVLANKQILHLRPVPLLRDMRRREAEMARRKAQPLSLVNPLPRDEMMSE